MGSPSCGAREGNSHIEGMRRSEAARCVSSTASFLSRMSGEEGAASDRSQKFAELLRAKFGMPVHLLDERLTSAEAHRVLDEAEVPGRRRKQMIDELAAVLILQQFLARQQTRQSSSEAGDDESGT